MEGRQLARRSASHGTLREATYSHAKSPNYHQSLKGANGPSVLLQSPGALESMLRTTTETGDIGIFSIRPIQEPLRPKPQTRRRATFVDKATLPLMPRLPVDPSRNQDGMKGPLAYKDTTSEILSMYGSDSQRSLASTLPSTDDFGPRSYTMTTCGSRHLARHKSTATLQSQYSGSQLQRPRSPFPYPTRLRRPGVRPSSPALTENGLVDYSRMVEIDRISHRTVHGPRRPHRAHGLSQSHTILPLSLPSNSITAPSQYEARLSRLVTHSVRSSSTAPAISWGTSHQEKLENTSSRASSLTSIVNMYHRIPHSEMDSHFDRPAPLFYDYSEQFENRPFRTADAAQPLAPVPTRTLKSQQPLVLREGPEEQFVASLCTNLESAWFERDLNPDLREAKQGDEGAQASKTIQAHCLTTAPASASGQPIFALLQDLENQSGQQRSSDLDTLPSQVGRESIDTFNPTLDVESKDTIPYDFSQNRVTAASKASIYSQSHKVQVRGNTAPTIRSEQGVIIREKEETPSPSIESSDDKRQPETNTATDPECRHQKRQSLGSIGAEHTTESKTTPTVEIFSKLDAVEFSGFGDCHSRYQDLEKPETTLSWSGGLRPEQTASGNQHIQSSKASDEKHNPTLVRQRIDVDGMMLKHAGPPENGEPFSGNSSSSSNDHIIAPAPISPVHQLRVKDSIPILMKALPPLPESSGKYKGFINEQERERCHNDLPAQPPASTCHEGTYSSQHEPKARRLSSIQQKLPKLRIRAKPTSYCGTASSRDSRPWNSDRNYPWSRESLNIRLATINCGIDVFVKGHTPPLAHSQLSEGDFLDATVRRNHNTPRSELVKEITNQPRHDLFGLTTNLSSVFRQVSRKFSHGQNDSHKLSTISGEEVLGNELLLESKLTSLEPDSCGSAIQPLQSEINTCSGASSSVSQKRRPRKRRKRQSILPTFMVRSGNFEDDGQTSHEVKSYEFGCMEKTGSLNIRGIKATGSESNCGEQSSEPRFRGRARGRISKWIKLTTTATRFYFQSRRKVQSP